jgi:hypothetical protein
MNPDGTLEHYKARWVIRGFNQRPGVDFGETFLPVVKPDMIRTVLMLVATYNWSAHQIDVSNAFLHGNLQEQVYSQQPTGFVDPQRPDDVCLLSRSLYGLRRAPRVRALRRACDQSGLRLVEGRLLHLHLPQQRSHGLPPPLR